MRTPLQDRRDKVQRASHGHAGRCISHAAPVGAPIAWSALVRTVLAAGLLGLCACATLPDPAQRYAAIVASADRAAADRINDERRKPAEMLAFIGVQPGVTALDVSAGRGYTTELLARATGPAGRVYGQRPPAAAAGASPPAQPEGLAAPRPAAAATTTMPTLAQRVTSFANMVAITRPFEDPAPPELANAGFDLVTLMFNYHDLGHLGVDRNAMNRSIFRALKPGGLYVIADHSGRPGTGISESGTLHRVEEAFVVREVQAAGFRLLASGDFLRNPQDPRDRNTPEPPMPKDEFVLKFVKP
jgi:predicted methyltransferase